MGLQIGVSDVMPIISKFGLDLVKICKHSLRVWYRGLAYIARSFKSISKEISMELNHLLKAGFGRRGFLSGSGLLLTGALLGTTEEAKAQPAAGSRASTSHAARQARQTSTA